VPGLTPVLPTLLASAAEATAIAAAATAAAATAEAATAAAATTAAAEAATATAATTAAARTLARLADGNRTTLQILTVEILDGVECAGIGRHLDEGKTTGTARVAIKNQLHLGHIMAGCYECIA
jgi:cell wall-associated NlpC family hydrolase